MTPHRKGVLTLSDRFLYRSFEIFPGALTWGTLAAMIPASIVAPIATSFFIIAFDLYWLLKSVFFAWHLRASYKKMQENLKVDWMARVRELPEWHTLYQLVIFPSYREPYETLKESFAALLRSSWPKEQMIVVLAIEERGGEEDRTIAERIAREYGAYFFRFFITVHPDGMPDEIPGKGSNETWAACEAKKIIDELEIPYERVVVSAMDSDTQVYPDYFAILAYRYLTEPDPLHASYQPVPLYHNNIWESPFFSRIISFSGTFWQMMQQVRPEQLVTFSSHSMPFKTLVEMGYWDTDVVSEDSHIFWQALLFYDGNWRTVPLYYPVSMDANLGSTFWETAKNVYRQQRRWAWGSENIAYLLFGSFKNPRMPLAKKIAFNFQQIEGFWTWATNSVIIFSLGWLPPLLCGNEFSGSVLAHNLPRVTQIIMTLAMIGLLSSAVVSLLILPPRHPHAPRVPLAWMFLQWLTIPLVTVVLGSIPAIEAQTRLALGNRLGFWPTPKHKREVKSKN